MGEVYGSGECTSLETVDKAADCFLHRNVFLLSLQHVVVARGLLRWRHCCLETCQCPGRRAELCVTHYADDLMLETRQY